MVATVVAVVGFGLILLVLYLAKVWQRRRVEIAGVRVQMRPRGVGAVALLMAVIWACLCGALALAVYTEVAAYVATIAFVVAASGMRPIIAKAGPAFVISSGGSSAAPDGGHRPDQAVFDEHREALARGEERVLRRTVAGTLHSYRKDEQVSPSDDPYNLRSLPVGILISSIYLGFAVFCAVMFFVGDGENYPAWVLPVGAVACVYGGRPAFVFCRDEYRASKIRKERGVLQPDRGKALRVRGVAGKESAV